MLLFWYIIIVPSYFTFYFKIAIVLNMYFGGNICNNICFIDIPTCSAQLHFKNNFTIFTFVSFYSKIYGITNLKYQMHTCGVQSLFTEYNGVNTGSLKSSIFVGIFPKL